MNENHCILSILIPVYNVDKYLRRCLDSIFNQNTAEIEVILVNDGSTDKSGNICDDYQQKYPNLCKVFHKENQGAYPTRNYALDRASGDFVWLIDPDDYIEKDAIEAIKMIISSNKDLEIITAAYRRFTDTWVGEIENVAKESKVITGEEYLVKGYFHNAYLWYHIYMRDFLIKNKIRFNDKINTQGDWLFNAHAYVVAKRIFLSDKLIYNYYKDNPTSTLARRDKPHLLRGVDNSLTAILEMNKLCEENKNTVVYEPLKQRLSLTVSGFLYSLYRFKIPIDVVKHSIALCKEKGLYPISKTNNRKANIFIKFANFKWPFIVACFCKNLFINK